MEEGGLGKQLRAARIRRGMSTQQAAELTEGAVSESAIRHLERGTRANPTIETLCALVKVYDIVVVCNADGIFVDEP